MILKEAKLRFDAKFIVNLQILNLSDNLPIAASYWKTFCEIFLCNP